MEWRGGRADGGVHWEHWTDTGIFDAEGRLIEIQCVGREVTDRKLAEAAREEAERLRLAALEAALDCYIGIDADGQVVEFNAAAERTFGYARAEAIGKPMVELIVPPHLRAAHCPRPGAAPRHRCVQHPRTADRGGRDARRRLDPADRARHREGRARGGARSSWPTCATSPSAAPPSGR